MQRHWGWRVTDPARDSPSASQIFRQASSCPLPPGIRVETTHHRLFSLELIVLGPPIVVHIEFRPVDAIVGPQWAHYPYAELIQAGKTS